MDDGVVTTGVVTTRLEAPTFEPGLLPAPSPTRMCHPEHTFKSVVSGPRPSGLAPGGVSPTLIRLGVPRSVEVSRGWYIPGPLLPLPRLRLLRAAVMHLLPTRPGVPRSVEGKQLVRIRVLACRVFWFVFRVFHLLYYFDVLYYVGGVAPGVG